VKCIIKIIWNDGVWYSKVSTDSGENVRLTLESGSFDALVERMKIAIPEMLELNFGYVGDIQLSFDVERYDSLKVAAS
jgi:hypothetical protein